MWGNLWPNSSNHKIPNEILSKNASYWPSVLNGNIFQEIVCFTVFALRVYLLLWLISLILCNFDFYFEPITQFLCSSNIKLEFMAVGKFAHQKLFIKLFNYHHSKVEIWKQNFMGEDAQNSVAGIDWYKILLQEHVRCLKALFKWPWQTIWYM